MLTPSPRVFVHGVLIFVGDIHGPCAGRAEAAGVERGNVSPDKLFTLPCGNVRLSLSLQLPSTSILSFSDQRKKGLVPSPNSTSGTGT